MGQKLEAEKDKTERATRLGRRTRERRYNIEKWDQTDSRRGGDIRIACLPLASISIKKLFKHLQTPASFLGRGKTNGTRISLGLISSPITGR